MCPYPEYEKCYRYYGQLDYGAVWMTAALNGQSTSDRGMSFEHGSEDFSIIGEQGRSVAVVTAAVTMNVRTQINRILTEWVIDPCRKCSTEDCPEILPAWDQAVAQYTGSMVEPIIDQPGVYESGHLYYGLADELCQDFSTCGIDGDDIEGNAYVNHKIIQHFLSGRKLLEQRTCGTAELVYGQIIHLMTVPLIQGILRSAYRLQYSHKDDVRERGRGVAYMASILPDLYDCSTADADFIHNELSLSTGMKTPDFEKIKAVFERNYNCLSVSCEDVGGLWDETLNDYVDGGHPCGVRRTHRRRESNRNSLFRDSQTTLLQYILFGCTGLVATVLIVSRRQWIQAVSSQIDFALSKFNNSDRSPYDPVEGIALEKLSTSSTIYDDQDTSSSSDYYEDGFDLGLTFGNRPDMDLSQRSDLSLSSRGDGLKWSEQRI